MQIINFPPPPKKKLKSLWEAQRLVDYKALFTLDTNAPLLKLDFLKIELNPIVMFLRTYSDAFKDL